MNRLIDIKIAWRMEEYAETTGAMSPDQFVIKRSSIDALCVEAIEESTDVQGWCIITLRNSIRYICPITYKEMREEINRARFHIGKTNLLTNNQ